MNGFSAADMSTAAANGHADGYQAGYADAVKAVEVGKPAAAQEAVAWFTDDHLTDRSATTYDAAVAERWRAKGWPVTPLYAAPVAAAPVVDGRDVRSAIAGIEGSVAVGSDGEWVSVRRTARDAAVTALRNLSSDCAHIYAAYAEAKASTPAAPGIDLEQFRARVPKAGEQIADILIQWRRNEIDAGGALAAIQAHLDACTFQPANDLNIGYEAGMRLAREVQGASPKGGAHADDLAVDTFAAALKEKLAAARAKGRGGWNGDEPGMQQRLSEMLREHVEKGDPRDVANFCMFLHQRGEGISPKGGINGRATFQRWAVSQNLSIQRSELHIGMGGDYVDRATSRAWEAWQAAMQATSAEVGHG